MEVGSQALADIFIEHADTWNLRIEVLSPDDDSELPRIALSCRGGGSAYDTMEESLGLAIIPREIPLRLVAYDDCGTGVQLVVTDPQFLTILKAELARS